jgi:hypothetical protein
VKYRDVPEAIIPSQRDNRQQFAIPFYIQHSLPTHTDASFQKTFHLIQAKILYLYIF